MLSVFPWTGVRFGRLMFDTCRWVSNLIVCVLGLSVTWLMSCLARCMTDPFLGAGLVSEVSRVVWVTCLGMTFVTGTRVAVRWLLRATALAPLSSKALTLLVNLIVPLSPVTMPVCSVWLTFVTLTVGSRLLTAAGTR